MFRGNLKPKLLFCESLYDTDSLIGGAFRLFKQKTYIASFPFVYDQRMIHFIVFRVLRIMPGYDSIDFYGIALTYADGLGRGLSVSRYRYSRLCQRQIFTVWYGVFLSLIHI